MDLDARIHDNRDGTTEPLRYSTWTRAEEEADRRNAAEGWRRFVPVRVQREDERSSAPIDFMVVRVDVGLVGLNNKATGNRLGGQVYQRAARLCEASPAMLRAMLTVRTALGARCSERVRPSAEDVTRWLDVLDGAFEAAGVDPGEVVSTDGEGPGTGRGDRITTVRHKKEG